MSITVMIIAFTVLISFMAFNNADLRIKMKHWPYAEARDQEYYRWLTSGFLHADPMHLIFNMLTLYFFAADQRGSEGLESWFLDRFPEFGTTIFMVFYLLAIVAASSATFFKYRNTPSFASIGASGAVAAVLFASILVHPHSSISFIFFPVPIPGYIFALGYLWYSSYSAKKGGDNIDHTAHFYGAVFGLLFLLALDPGLAQTYVHEIMG
jgi:membrane associated rhomboid family serine protease